MALECMKIILQDVWKSVTGNWESFLDVCNNHVSILEDKIYEYVFRLHMSLWVKRSSPETRLGGVLTIGTRFQP